MFALEKSCTFADFIGVRFLLPCLYQLGRKQKQGWSTLPKSVATTYSKYSPSKVMRTKLTINI